MGQKIVDLLRWKTFSSKCTVKTWSNMFVSLPPFFHLPPVLQSALCADFPTLFLSLTD